MRQIGLIVALVALMGLVSVTLAGPAEGTRRAPDFALPDWQNHWFRLSEHRGQVVVLEFMQTGCEYCQDSASILEELYRKYKDRGLVVVAVSHDPNGEKDIQPFVAKYGLTYPILLGDLSIAVRYIGITREHNSFSIPYIFLIDRRGFIVGEFVRDKTPEFFANEKANLEKEIQRLLKQPAGSTKVASTQP